MANHVLTFKATVANPTISLTAANVFTNSTDDPVTVRYVSERASHISLTGAATAADALVPANCIELLNIDPGKALSVIRESSETDGPAWVTEVARV